MQSVQVLARIRPQTYRGRKPTVVAIADTTIQVDSQEQATFTFDNVVGPDGSQEDIFEVAGEPMVTKCLQGYNCCVFTYGQTGSGKTFTMWGDSRDPSRPEVMPKQAGLIPRIVADLLSRVNVEGCLEVYNETVVDLLDVEKGYLQLRESRSGRVYVENVNEELVNTEAQASSIINQGLSNRQTAATDMNRESSRSHCILMCTVTRKEKIGPGMTKETSSRLNLVDLAGSERQKTSRTTNGRLKEACGINKSLSTLGHVIKSLSEQQRGKERHIHYRESKLTYLLQDSLGGNSRTLVIANLSSDYINLEETISTLRFAQRAKNIKNKAIINESCRGDNSALQEEIEMLRSTVSDLRLQLDEGRQKSADLYQPPEPIRRSNTLPVASTIHDDYVTQKMGELESENRRLRHYLRRAMERGSQASRDAILLSATLAGTRLELEAEKEKGARDIYHLRNAAQKLIQTLCTKLGIAKQVVSTMNSDMNNVQSVITKARKLARPLSNTSKGDFRRAMKLPVEAAYKIAEPVLRCEGDEASLYESELNVYANDPPQMQNLTKDVVEQEPAASMKKPWKCTGDNKAVEGKTRCFTSENEIEMENMHDVDEYMKKRWAFDCVKQMAWSAHFWMPMMVVNLAVAWAVYHSTYQKGGQE